MKTFAAISWAITTLFCALALFVLVISVMTPGSSAIQQAAGGAVACALVVVPYVFTRAVEAFANLDYVTARNTGIVIAVIIAIFIGLAILGKATQRYNGGYYVAPDSVSPN